MTTWRERDIRWRWQSHVIPEWSNPDMAQAQHDICDALGEIDRLRAALERIASPNRGAKPTGQDALDMAAYAREVLGPNEPQAIAQ